MTARDDLREAVARTKRMGPWSKDAGITVSKREWEQMRADLNWWADVADILGAVVSGWTFRKDATFVFPNGQSHSLPGWLAETIAREVEAALTAARPVIERETREACAKVAEGYDAPHLNGVGERIAAAIRGEPT